MKSVKTWIVIADGAQARVFENTGAGSWLVEIKELESNLVRQRARDIMADRPGRSYSSGSSNRSAMEPPTDPVQKREADFVHEFLHALAKGVEENDVDRIILAAAPRALGDMRKVMPPSISSKVMEELPKDLTNVKFEELPAYFSEMVKL